MSDLNPSLKLAIKMATAEYEAKIRSIAEEFSATYESLLASPEIGIAVSLTLSRTRADTGFNAFQRQHAQQIKENQPNEGKFQPWFSHD